MACSVLESFWACCPCHLILVDLSEGVVRLQNCNKTWSFGPFGVSAERHIWVVKLGHKQNCDCEWWVQLCGFRRMSEDLVTSNPEIARFSLCGWCTYTFFMTFFYILLRIDWAYRADLMQIWQLHSIVYNFSRRDFWKY